MKHLLTLSAALVALIDARVVPKLSWSDLSAIHVESSDIANASDRNVTIAVADLWQEAINRGGKLMTGMKSDGATAATLFDFPTAQLNLLSTAP